MNSVAKKGRPVGTHRTASGDIIVGLTRLSDGRWKIGGTSIKFTEPDEHRAVARFHKIVAERQGTSKVLVPMPAAEDGHAAGKAMVKAATGTFVARISPDPSKPITLQRTFDTAELWAWLREELYKRPKWVAERVGIEELGYLTSLKKPTASPKLAEVGKLYTDRTDIGEKETNKCKTTWAEFSNAVGVATLRELTPEAVALWGMSVKKKGLAAKTTYHAFNRIKTILNHFRTTGLAIDDVRHALDCCAVLKAPETTSLDPHPISRANFAKLLDKAEGEGKAMLLVALNLCMYPIDLVRLKWTELDLDRGVYHAKRGKTKVARCGVLWGRTIEALMAIDRSDELVFHKTSGQPHTDTTIRKWFWELRETAEVAKEVQFADIRDGSFTEAVAGEGVEFAHARILAGHRSGIADAYVLRNPKMVTKACAAVEAAYFG